MRQGGPGEREDGTAASFKLKTQALRIPLPQALKPLGPETCTREARGLLHTRVHARYSSAASPLHTECAVYELAAGSLGVPSPWTNTCVRRPVHTSVPTPCTP
eukprot:892794-Rhodomonas_salina.1